MNHLISLRDTTDEEFVGLVDRTMEYGMGRLSVRRPLADRIVGILSTTNGERILSVPTWKS